MLVTLGKRVAAENVVDLLLECHHRIRTFTAMAVALGKRPETPASDIVTIAAQVRRYFAEALPLHAADEDRDIAPRLVGRDPAVDQALRTMSSDHVDHGPAIARLLAICGVLECEPHQLATLAPELAELAVELEAKFAEHLALEESVIFPALRALPAGELDAVKAALRARRAFAG